MSLLLLQGSAGRLPLADGIVQTCVTSPPYWGLRQYAGGVGQVEMWGSWSDVAPPRKHPERHRLRLRWRAWERGGLTIGKAWIGALGLEPTPELYVDHMVAVFREVRRVLRADGTLWLNIGDSYAASTVGAGGQGKQHSNVGSLLANRSWQIPAGLKPKDLVGIPWMVAFALRADGWYLRSDVIWHKPNPMPESVTDRPTKAHEYLFLLTKSERYFYDADAIREPALQPVGEPKREGEHKKTAAVRGDHGYLGSNQGLPHRNKRTVWTIATRPYPGAHFATFPETLVEPCILAGSARQACGVCGAPWERQTERTHGYSYDTPKTAAAAAARGGRGATSTVGQSGGGRVDGKTVTLGWRPTCTHQDGSGTSLVLDPFNGSGTTGRVAIRHGRSYVGVDISREYLVEQSKARINNIQHTLGMEAAS